MISIYFSKFISLLRNIKRFLASKSGRNYKYVLGSGIIVSIVSALRGFFVAKILGPVDFGLLKGVQLVSDLSKYGNLGFSAVVSRDVPHYQHENENEKYVNKIKQTSYSCEALLGIILSTIAILLSFTFNDKYIQIAVILAALGLLFGKLERIVLVELRLQKKFVLLSKSTALVSLVVSVLVILLLYKLGIYAAIGVPAFASFIFAFLVGKYIKINYRLKINFGELRRQLRIGIPLALTTLSYGGYRYAERIVLLSTKGLEYLGYYGLATFFMDQILNLFQHGYKVRGIKLQELVGKGDYSAAHKMVFRETILLMAIAILVCGVGVFMIELFVELFLDEYSNAILACKIILLAIPIRLMGDYAYTVLVSPLVNKQKITPLANIIATVILVSGAGILYLNDNLTFTNYILIDVIGFFICHAIYVIWYYRYFYIAYVKK